MCQSMCRRRFQKSALPFYCSTPVLFFHFLVRGWYPEGLPTSLTILQTNMDMGLSGASWLTKVSLQLQDELVQS